MRKSNGWKKTASFLMAFALVTSGMSVNVGGFLNSSTANAAAITSLTEGTFIQVGDELNIPAGAYVRLDDDPGAAEFDWECVGVEDAVIEEVVYSYDDNQYNWVCDKYITENYAGFYFTSDKLDTDPTGFYVTGGDGSKENPYTFGLTYEAPADPTFATANLTLGDVLGLNFYLDDTITAENAADYTVKFSGNCLEADAPVSLTEKGGKYLATATVYAKDTNSKITATLYKGEDELDTLTYSVSDYLSDVVNPEKNPTPPTDKETIALIKATQLFGNASDEYFYDSDLNVTDAISAYMTQADLTDEKLMLAVQKYAFNADDAKLSLVLDSRTAIRLYIKGLAEGDKDNSNTYEAKTGGKGSGDYKYYFEIADLNPQQLSTANTISFGDNTYTFSALSWANRVLNSEEESAKNINMAKAIVAYALAADAYTAE